MMTRNSGAMSVTAIVLPLLLLCGTAFSAPAAGVTHISPVPTRLLARTYNSGFADSHDTYNGLSAASNGRIYYVLCSEKFDEGAQVFVFDPGTQRIRRLGDLTEACGEKGARTIVQGKSHVNFVEAGDRLYFATHVGYYSLIDGMEKIGLPPDGWKPYPGGHLLAFNLKISQFEDLGIPVAGEGVLTMNMDPKHGVLFGLSWPSGIFFRHNLGAHQTKLLGKTCAEGENGKDAAYRTLCRSIAVTPDDGSAYLTTSEGTILRYRAETDTLAPVPGEDLKKDYFGLYDPASPGHMGYNWRQTVRYSRDGSIYGVHGNSGYLFRFDPHSARVEVLDRITSEPSKRSGMFDQFSYGYLGFTLGPDGHTLHYLTGAPIYVEGQRVRGKSSTAMGEAKGLEDLHLVTYDIATSRYQDHGAIFYENGQRPLYVNSIAVGKDGTVYFLARITEGGKTRTDLVSVPGPLKR